MPQDVTQSTERIAASPPVPSPRPTPTDPTPRQHPAGSLDARIARLERSLTIQTEGLAEDLVKVNDSSLSEVDQAGLEASVYFTRRDIAGLHEQINELRDEQAGARQSQAVAA